MKYYQYTEKFLQITQLAFKILTYFKYLGGYILLIIGLDTTVRKEYTAHFGKT